MNVWVLVRLCKTKMWWKTKIVLYGYSKFHCIQKEDIYKDIVENVETRFDNTNDELKYNAIDRPLAKIKNKKLIGLMKDELGRKITKNLLN